jgi:hypothetical protein
MPRTRKNTLFERGTKGESVPEIINIFYLGYYFQDASILYNDER